MAAAAGPGGDETTSLPPSSSEDPALAHCVVKAQVGSTRELRCRTLVALVAEGPSDGLSDAVATGISVGDFWPLQGESVQTRAEAILLGGQERTVQRWDLGGELGLAGLSVSGQGPRGWRRVIVAAPSADPGGAIAATLLLEALLAADSLDLPADDGRVAFLGRPLTLPPGCVRFAQRPGVEVVSCDGRSTQWTLVPVRFDASGAEAYVETLTAEFRQLVEQGVRVERPACTVDGVPGACLLIRKGTSLGGMIQAVVPWKGVGVEVICMLEAHGELPPVCDQLVQLDTP